MLTDNVYIGGKITDEKLLEIFDHTTYYYGKPKNNKNKRTE